MALAPGSRPAKSGIKVEHGLLYAVCVLESTPPVWTTHCTSRAIDATSRGSRALDTRFTAHDAGSRLLLPRKPILDPRVQRRCLRIPAFQRRPGDSGQPSPSWRQATVCVSGCSRSVFWEALPRVRHLDFPSSVSYRRPPRGGSGTLARVVNLPAA